MRGFVYIISDIESIGKYKIIGSSKKIDYFYDFLQENEAYNKYKVEYYIDVSNFYELEIQSKIQLTKYMINNGWICESLIYCIYAINSNCTKSNIVVYSTHFSSPKIRSNYMEKFGDSDRIIQNFIKIESHNDIQNCQRKQLDDKKNSLVDDKANRSIIRKPSCTNKKRLLYGIIVMIIILALYGGYNHYNNSPRGQFNDNSKLQKKKFGSKTTVPIIVPFRVPSPKPSYGAKGILSKRGGKR